LGFEEKVNPNSVSTPSRQALKGMKREEAVAKLLALKIM
jgi:hypothetical protein